MGSRQARIRRLLPHSLPLLFASALLLHAARGNTCSCGFDTPDVRPNDQADGETPANTRVWLPSSAVESAQRSVSGDFQNPRDDVAPTAQQVVDLVNLVHEQDGTSVSFGVTPIVDLDGNDVYYMLTPTEPLAPGRYMVEPIIVGDEAASFTVGEHTSDEAPDAPAVVERHTHSEPGAGSSCGEARAKSFTIQHSAPFSVVEFGQAAEFEPALWRTGLFTEDKRLTIGNLACAGNTWNFDDGPTRVSFAAMDLAGNTSEWTEPERVYVEDPGSSFGCSLNAAPSGSGPWWAAIALLWTLRRRTLAVRRATSVDAHD